MDAINDLFLQSQKDVRYLLFHGKSNEASGMNTRDKLTSTDLQGIVAHTPIAIPRPAVALHGLPLQKADLASFADI